MSERYTRFLELRGRPRRIRTRISREAYILSRKPTVARANEKPIWDPLPALSAVGPASDF